MVHGTISFKASLFALFRGWAGVDLLFMKNPRLVCSLLVLILPIFTPLYAQDSVTVYELKEIGRVIQLEGTVSRKPVDSETEQTLTLGLPVWHYDTIITAANSKARIEFLDQSQLSLNENTSLKLTRYLYEPEKGQLVSLFDLVAGEVRAVIGEFLRKNSENSFEIETSFSVAGVRGSEFVVRTGPSGTTVEGIASTIYLENRAGKVLQLSPGKVLFVHPTQGFRTVKVFSIEKTRRRFRMKGPRWRPPAGFRRKASRRWRAAKGRHPPKPWIRKWHPHKRPPKPRWALPPGKRPPPGLRKDRIKKKSAVKQKVKSSKRKRRRIRKRR